MSRDQRLKNQYGQALVEAEEAQAERQKILQELRDTKRPLNFEGRSAFAEYEYGTAAYTAAIEQQQIDVARREQLLLSLMQYNQRLGLPVTCMD